MVAMPKKEETHIQKMAPGPPAAMAVAAPAMLPVPIWAATAVARDWKELIPPCVFAFLEEKTPPNMAFMPSAQRRTCTNRRRKVK